LPAATFLVGARFIALDLAILFLFNHFLVFRS